MKLQTMPLRFKLWNKMSNSFCSILLPNGMLSTFFCIEELPQWLGSNTNNFVISQDTGLKDKNGRCIYTGDIVKALVSEENPFTATDKTKGVTAIGQIEFVRGKVVLARNGNVMNGVDLHKKPEEQLEIIGNIWQHPELLGEG